MGWFRPERNSWNNRWAPNSSKTNKQRQEFLGGDDRKLVSQVLGGGSLPDHQPHPQGQSFLGFLFPGAFVVGFDSGGDVSIQVFSGEERGG